MSERLTGLRDDEKAACFIAERALGAVATPYDRRPRQGAVDAILEYPDHRRAAFEVTWLATDDGDSLQLDALLSRDRFRWPLPGKWWWTIQIADPIDLPRLRGAYERIVLLCEAVGVTRPEHLRLVDADADVRWLTEESSVRMRGHPPRAPKVDGEHVWPALVTQPSTGGFSDETFSELDDALARAFSRVRIRQHVDKLERAEADERHLFVIVGIYDLPFPLFDAVAFGGNLPNRPPALPEGLTHLWLAPVHAHRVILGTVDGWSESRELRLADDRAE